jgi:hypothetical protein
MRYPNNENAIVVVLFPSSSMGIASTTAPSFPPSRRYSISSGSNGEMDLDEVVSLSFSSSSSSPGSSTSRVAVVPALLFLTPSTTSYSSSNAAIAITVPVLPIDDDDVISMPPGRMWRLSIPYRVESEYDDIPNNPIISTNIAQHAPLIDFTVSSNTNTPHTNDVNTTVLEYMPTAMASPACRMAYTLANPPGTLNSPESMPQ